MVHITGLYTGMDLLAKACCCNVKNNGCYSQSLRNE